MPRDLDNLRAWKQANRAKLNAQQRAYNRRHPAKIKALNAQRDKPTMAAKARAKRQENPEAARAYDREWYARDPAKLVAKSVQWAKDHPGKVLERQHRRTARKNAAPRNDLTAEQWQTILHAFDHRCVYCPYYKPDCLDCRKRTHKLTRDHVTPYALNGSNTLWNVVPSCRSCNCKKRTGPTPGPVQPLLL
jgi:MoaA/NifB/PqqE/SkfB family radical SAM enzyme